jgi:PAS domain S-box-containing protein
VKLLSHISTLIAVQNQTGLSFQQNWNWFRELAEDLPQLVWASDENGKKTFCNHRYFDFTGVTDLEAMDRLWTGFIHRDDRAPTFKKWMDCLRSGEPYTAEYRLLRRDGTYRHVKAQALPTRDENGRINGWLGMSKDINEERVAEQLRETEAKIQAVRRLASSIAHEINNPLESVTNALFLALQDRNIDEDTRNYLNMADAELHRLAHITTNSLRFHRQSTAPIQIQPANIVEEVLSTYRTRLRAAEITLDREYSNHLRLLCHADDLSQAVAHLIRNSIDATQPGGRLIIRVRDSRSRTAPNRPGVRITVADTGEGICRELRGRLFEPFFTTKGATRTGLALWITDQIVRKHGGKISIRTSTDPWHHGTVFSMFLPIDGIDADTLVN